MRSASLEERPGGLEKEGGREKIEVEKVGRIEERCA